MAAARNGVNYPQGDADRQLAWAVVASLIAHAILLAVLPLWLDASNRKAASLPPLIARLVQPRPMPEPLVKPKMARETPREAPRTPSPVDRPQPRLLAPPTPSPAPPVQVAPSITEPPKSVDAPQPSAPAIPQAPVARIETSPTPPSAPMAGDSMDPATLGQYRIAIISAAKRYKRYPRLAIDNNWEGKAEVRMVIGADGSIASITVKSGSGFELLDQQAVEMIRKAKPLTPIPPSLRGRGFTIDVPVVFSLKEETG